MLSLITAESSEPVSQVPCKVLGLVGLVSCPTVARCRGRLCSGYTLVAANAVMCWHCCYNPSSVLLWSVVSAVTHSKLIAMILSGLRHCSVIIVCHAKCLGWLTKCRIWFCSLSCFVSEVLRGIRNVLLLTSAGYSCLAGIGKGAHWTIRMQMLL